MAQRKADERGAILPLVSAFLAVLITSVSFSVDLGRLAAEKRSVQSVVDLVAIDAARVIDGRPAAEIYTQVEAAAEESALRNEFVADELKDMTVELGVWDWARRSFEAMAPSAASIPNGVRIRAGSLVPFFFTAYEFETEREAIAVRRIPGTTPDAKPDSGSGDGSDGSTTTTTPGGDGTTTTVDPCEVGDLDCPAGAISAFSLGSSLLGLRGEVATPIFLQQKVDFLNTLLPAQVQTPTAKWNATLAGYEGLAAADVTLDEMRIAGGFASVSQLLEAEVTYAQLMTLTVAALSSQPGGGISVEGSGVLAIAATAGSSQRFAVGELIKVQQGMGGAAAEAAINVANLVIEGAMLTAGARLADGGSAISVPLATAIPGVVTSTLDLAVIQPPVIAIGPAGQDSTSRWLTRARTAQVRGQLNTVYTVKPDPALGILYSQVSVPIVLDGADATGVLRSIECQPEEADKNTAIGVDTTALAAYIGNASSLTAEPLVVNQATLVEQVLLNIKGRSDVVVPGASGILSFFGPFSHQNRQSVGAGYPLIGVGTQLDANLTTNPVTYQQGMKAALLPYLTLLDDHVIKPLASTLGLEVGGAEVANFKVECGTPVLVS